MARRFKKERSIKRRGSHRNPKKEIWVVCEGKVTEPEYIKDFSRDNRHALVSVDTIAAVGAPMSLVTKAKEKKEELLRAAKRSKDSFQRNFEVWCISDCDEHPRLDEAMTLASDAGIKYALSNPCIELWGYLHYKMHDAPTHRHKMQQLLEAEMTGYSHKTNAIFNYKEIQDKYDEAKQRAQRLEQNRVAEDNERGNPSTTLYQLLDSIKTDQE